jgi:hypothetical protein
MKLKIFALILVAISHINVALAGSPAGPYLLFFNLEKSKDKAISKYVTNYVRKNQADTYCDRHSDGAITFIREHPPEFSESLIIEAFVQRKPKSIEQLQRLLRNYRSPSDEILNGLDGIVVYLDIPVPEMLSLDTKSKNLKKAHIIGVVTEESAMHAYCKVFPNVYRQ